MDINTVIDKLKNFYSGIDFDGNPINEELTRDKILYGTDQLYTECEGIVTTCWASIEVIEKAIQLGANLIICHEALFWNHGDETKWLEDTENRTYLSKKELLEKNRIVVWRNHDYIHSGFPIDNRKYADGIFYGLANKLGWTEFISDDLKTCRKFKLPETTVNEIGNHLLSKLKVNGVKIIGDLSGEIKNIYICDHIIGVNDREIIEEIDQEEIDLLIALELIDYTVLEYVRDRSLLKSDLAILTIGHFNTEEPGMEYMLEYMDLIIDNQIPKYFIQSGDMYNYIVR